MGYYVGIEEADFKVKKENFENAYKAMCALNDFDNLKRGGGYGGDISSSDPRPEGYNYHPAKWFSWMSPNYPELLNDFVSIMVELGFEHIIDENGDYVLLRYDNKSGQEELFLNAISEYVEDGSFIQWIGEDAQQWMVKYIDKKMYVFEGVVKFENPKQFTTML